MDSSLIFSLLWSLSLTEYQSMNEDEEMIITTNVLKKFSPDKTTKYLEPLILTHDLIDKSYDQLLRTLNAAFKIQDDKETTSTFKDIKVFVTTLDQMASDERKYAYFNSRNDSLTFYTELEGKQNLPKTLLIPMIIRVMLSIGANLALTAEKLDNVILYRQYVKIIDLKSKLNEIETDLEKNLTRMKDVETTCQSDYPTTNWLIFQLSSFKDGKSGDDKLKAVIRVIADEMKKSEERAVYFENAVEAFLRKDDPAIQKLRKNATASRMHKKYLERMLTMVFKLIDYVGKAVYLAKKVLNEKINAIACHAFLRRELKKYANLIEAWAGVNRRDKKSAFVDKIVQNTALLIRLIKAEIKFVEERMVRGWYRVENALERAKETQLQLLAMGAVAQIGEVIERSKFQRKCRRIKYIIHTMETDIERVIVRELKK